MSRSKRKEAISTQELRRLASLARLSLTPSEERRLAREIGEIVSYFATIDSAKVERLEASYHVVEAENILRDDTRESFDADSILKMVPHKRGRHVKAPRVF
ncbi:MAG: Asp-tRNA(Asn)/Glu-tRNA(Gln) amidotransferase subunit GatC [Thaumarchaeota archaeon]|nr:Asp-tRNA(Asn)/Glu-tRNA(Gln) amidotransferase subunit GatC [Nitrososphaerota archaeon]MBI3022305.1 Asp-tRNA(Asn)/Glu-tRNA(Gln) amidotransferase subunit GatC [Nitrososphaerota archaeon]MBI3117023.1 Asp-tRNA(Asn)/Glu-tRNA(Gln) amidotransferase subunit GatC [Nitrososphaerota archaeon]MCS4539769.1 Asp-tRNA(Asn)/Glu-tRNA(Gln) amidotransferase subunit GatC [Nitrososphaerota archaeon]